MRMAVSAYVEVPAEIWFSRRVLRVIAVDCDAIRASKLARTIFDIFFVFQLFLLLTNENEDQIRIVS